MPKLIIKKLTILKTIENIIKIFSKKQNFPIIIIKIKRGGFETYFAGLIGFLPRSHYIKSKTNLRKNLQNKKYLNQNLLEIIPSRLSLTLAKIKINKPKKIKKNSTNAYITGVIFLHKKQEYKQYKYYLLKKRVQNHDNFITILNQTNCLNIVVFLILTKQIIYQKKLSILKINEDVELKHKYTN
jgi:hypothetical protein